MDQRWAPGQVVVRREVLGFEHRERNTGIERVWFGYPVHVVSEDNEQLVTYVGPGAEFGFVPGEWPTESGRHPLHGRTSWGGHGCLMVHRPGDEYAVWHLWQGEDRSFMCWYVNFQAAFRRVTRGFDTLDFELDIVVFPDGTWMFKDLEVLGDRVAAGRLAQGTVDRVLALGDEIARELDAGHHRWDARWVDWSPPAGWCDARLPADWAAQLDGSQ